MAFEVFTAANLLSRGFLPAELPPAFNSLGLEPWWTSLSQQDRQRIAKLKAYSPVVFHLARHGGRRRKLHIPDPLHYAALCGGIQRHSGLIQEIYSGSSLSTSTPSCDERRAVNRKLNEEALLDKRAATRRTARYVVKTDITNFYGSIYTHSIEWCFLGKQRAKEILRNQPKPEGTPLDENERRKAATELDRAVRYGQDGQSIGLPVGPDASLIISEMLLSKADHVLCERARESNLGVLRGFRHVDDYEIAARTLPEAETILGLIHSVLQETLELELNGRKTRIIELPAPLEASWVTELKGIMRRDDTWSSKDHHSARSQRRSMLRLLDRAIALRDQHPGEHVLSYVAGILRNYTLDPSNWSIARSWIMQAMLAEPGALRALLGDLLSYQSIESHAASSEELDDLHDVLTQIIVRHAPQTHSSEVVWALWAHLEFRLPIDCSASRHLEQLDDPIAALVGLHLKQEGLWTGDPPKLWRELVRAESLSDGHWMLAYEAAHKRWLDPPDDKPPWSHEPTWRTLHKADVSFYDTSKRMPRLEKITDGRRATTY